MNQLITRAPHFATSTTGNEWWDKVLPPLSRPKITIDVSVISAAINQLSYRFEGRLVEVFWQPIDGGICVRDWLFDGFIAIHDE